MKFARRELISSTFDSAIAGRRMTEEPLVIIFLCAMSAEKLF